MARTWFKKIFLVLLLGVTTADGGSTIMTRSRFERIELGASIQTVVQEHGQPYSIKTNPDGSQDYKYIERIPVAEQTAEENIYIVVVKNGKVVSKRYNQELPPAYDEIYDDDPNDVPN